MSYHLKADIISGCPPLTVSLLMSLCCEAGGMLVGVLPLPPALLSLPTPSSHVFPCTDDDKPDRKEALPKPSTDEKEQYSSKALKTLANGGNGALAGGARRGRGRG